MDSSCLKTLFRHVHRGVLKAVFHFGSSSIPLPSNVISSQYFSPPSYENTVAACPTPQLPAQRNERWSSAQLRQRCAYAHTTNRVKEMMPNREGRFIIPWRFSCIRKRSDSWESRVKPVQLIKNGLFPGSLCCGSNRMDTTEGWKADVAIWSVILNPQGNSNDIGSECLSDHNLRLGISVRGVWCGVSE